MRLKTLTIVVITLIAGFAGGWFAHKYAVDIRPLAEAREAFQRGEYELCVRLATTRLLQTGDSDKAAMLLAAQAHTELGHWSDAIRLFRQLVLRSSEDYALYARSYFYAGRPEDALSVCRTGLKNLGPSARLYELEARLLAYLERSTEALAAADRLRKMPDRQLAAELISGLIQYSSKNYTGCCKELMSALQRSPTLEGQSPDFPSTTRLVVIQFLSDALLRTERYEEADKYGREWFELEKSGDAAYFVSRCARERGDPQEQEKWLRKALEIDGENVQSLIDLANIKIVQRKYNEAEPLARRALVKDAKNKAALQILDLVERNNSASKGQGASK